MIKTPFCMRRFIFKCNSLLSIKARIYYALIGISLTGSFLGFINTWLLGEEGLGLWATAACFIFLLWIAIYTGIRKNIDRSLIFLCTGLNFLIFPLNYIGSGGLNSGMPIYFIAGIFSINLLEKARPRFILTTLATLNYSAIIFYSYLHPEKIIPMPSAFASHIDAIIALIIVSFMLSTSIHVVLFAYRCERKKASRLNRQLQSFAIKDPLTRLYNRRYLSEQLSIHTEIAQKKETPFSVIMLDIDHFKKINDTYGHLVGDCVLQNVARILHQETSSRDIAGRYGGEEFLLLLFDSNLEEAASLAEKIRLHIENTLFTKGNVHLTISGGVAAYTDGMEALDLIAVADKNLYHAKQTGRNKIVVKDPHSDVLALYANA